MTTQRPQLPLWELVQTAHVVARRFTEVFAEAGLTPAQYGVLASLTDGDDLSQADLAREVLVRPQSMGRLIGSMVHLGLVERAGPGGRGRRAGLTLTDHGRRALDQARPAAYAINQPTAVGLDRASIGHLIDYLIKIRSAMNNSTP